MTGLVFTLMWFPLVGYAVSKRVGPMNWFLAGAGVNGLVLFVTGELRVTLFLIALGAIWSAVAPATALKGERRLRSPHSRLPIGVLTIVLLAIAARTPLRDFDGRAFWLLKAKAITHESSIDGPFFHGQTSLNPRNEYPLLVPLDAATIMLVSRDLDDRNVRWLYVFFAAASPSRSANA